MLTQIGAPAAAAVPHGDSGQFPPVNSLTRQGGRIQRLALGKVAVPAVAALARGYSATKAGFRPQGEVAASRIAAVGKWTSALQDSHLEVVPIDGGGAFVDGSVPVSIDLVAARADAPFRLEDRIDVRVCNERGELAPCDLSDNHAGVGAFTQPVVIRRGGVVVVASAANQKLAQATAVQGASDFAELRVRYRALRPPKETVLMITDNAPQASVLIAEGTASSQDALAETDWSGKVVLHLEKFDRKNPLFRENYFATVRHELTHAAAAGTIMRRTARGWTERTSRVPTVLAEGLAYSEEAIAVRRVDPRVYLDLSPLHEMATTGAWRLPDLLASDRGFYGGTATNVAHNYELGLALVEAIEQRHGHAAVVRLYNVAAARGFAPATRIVLHASVASVSEEARRWAAAHRTLR